ncbi:maltotransferase domain-containing protein [Streptomyces sp. KLOTTS4A1]|uniref:alpha-1,4-glucan--maltose-1-phosphate maltosyltransferase n=1 Tax=Streptomyces sp. KLOTTS4A1 TaxID=3390996 RepID=UPI0039F633C1
MPDGTQPMSGRIQILDVRPVVECGVRPAKAVTGETFEVSATVFCEGDAVLAARVLLREPGAPDGAATSPLSASMWETAPGTDRWSAEVTPHAPGRWTYCVEAWTDPIATWRRTAGIKIPAGIDTGLVLEEGADLYEQAAAGVPEGCDRQRVLDAVAALRDDSRPVRGRCAAALTPELDAVLARHPLRRLVTASAPLPLSVERERALYGAWYELFPRSTGGRDARGSPVHGTLRTAAEALERVAAMGFDVVYLPPVHPIGSTFRKGRDNALRAGPQDVGVPWAVGSAEGGHDAVHPQLGTVADFEAFVRRARGLGLEVALDFALQCSPDHPWVDKHPEWFRRRPDGSIAYAENPPKKYQDIYPLDFDRDMPGLVAETVRVLRFWMVRGVRVFRVDNPHTKPVMFWEQVIAEINGEDPDVIFLAEAFTRPAMMHTLARVGFQQSYTYFTWRTTKSELTEYVEELAAETGHFLRPNFFVNTPDILHACLQDGGRPAFETRAVLAATLSPSWGMYSGYEVCENTPLRPGGEEYLHSEKYELRPRDWAAAEREGRSIAPLITRLNRIRRRHPALHELRNVRFHPTDNDALIAYSKHTRTPTGADTVLVVVNLDPHHAQEGTLFLDRDGAWSEGPLRVHDELSGETYHWGRHNYVRLEAERVPAPAHVLTVERDDDTRH